MLVPVIKRASSHFQLHSLDGLVAVSLAIIGMLPRGHVLATVRGVFSSRVMGIDAIAAVLFVFAWHYCFSLLNLYNKFATIPSRITATLQGVSFMMVPIIIYYKLVHPGAVTFRSIVITMAILFFYATARVALSFYLLDLIAARDPRRAIIVGSGRRASKAWRAIRTRYRSSISLLGFVDDRDLAEMPPDVARRYLGSLDDLSNILLKNVVDLVLIAMPIRSCYGLMQRAVSLAEGAGIQVVYLEDIYSTRRPNEDPNQLIFRDLAPDQEQYLVFLAAKRFVDVIGAAVGLILFSPVFLCIAILVKLTSEGPAIFKQERYGQHRRRFTLFKFRSMVVDAEKLLPLYEHANEASGPIFKMRNDPRVTKLGRFLRTTSLDELPQLMNVLLGDMSLVGPRPMSLRDVSLFDEAALMRRFSVKPGMTGLWQINGRSGVGFDEWVRMDNRYIDDWSLTLDLKILARTLGKVIKRSGAV